MVEADDATPPLSHGILRVIAPSGSSTPLEVQDEAGQPLPGLAAANCEPITGDDVARTVAWKGSPALSVLCDRLVRLRFIMDAADLFSMKFNL